MRSFAADHYANKELILVDDGSSDGAVQRVQEVWPAVRIIHTVGKRGPAAGNNAGFAGASKLGVKYSFLHNHDTTLERVALSGLVQAGEQNLDAGVLAPVSHRHEAPAKIWFSGPSLCLSRGRAVAIVRSPQGIH